MLWPLGNVGLPLLAMLSVFCSGWGASSFCNDSSVLLVLIPILTFYFSNFVSKNVAGFSFLTCLFAMLFFFTDSQAMFYVFFEAAIFPVVVLIVFYGNTFERFEASYFLIFFSAASSYPLLAGLGGGFLMSQNFFVGSLWSFLFLFAFMVKLPVYFVHYWLPKAHVEAPTVGSMILAGVLLKLGGWGMIRMMNFTMLSWWSSLFVVMMCLGAILAPLWAASHSDVKGLVAFSSISHMNFSCISIFLGASLSKTTSILVFLTHDVVSCMMFWLVGTLYHLSASRQIIFLCSVPQMGVFFSGLSVLVLLSNFSVPPALSFFHEFCFISIVFSMLPGASVLVAVYVVLVSYFTLFLTLNLFIFKESAGKFPASGLETALLAASVFLMLSLPLARSMA